MMANELKLNEQQQSAINKLNLFMQSKYTNFLLLGAAGSGKTTTIVKAFNGSGLSIAFCAFTNKATSVLLQISHKFTLNFNAEFTTIHTLLKLKPEYNNDKLVFRFDKIRLDMVKYDVIVFDECSTISKELYSFITHAYKYTLEHYGKSLKYIFLGDFWQIPPVNEKSSIVFSTAKAENWPISKLITVMRSNNEFIYNLNINLISWIELFKKDRNSAKLNKLISGYPFNLAKKSTGVYSNNMHVLINTYFNKRNEDIVILTHSRKNSDDINNMVQDMIDIDRNGNNTSEQRHKYIRKFYIGDKCWLERPIILTAIQRKHFQERLINNPNIQLIGHGEELETKLYNGEIFDVIYVEDVLVENALSKHTNIFNGQLLTISLAGRPSDMYEIIFIPQDDIINACMTMKRKLKRSIYNNILSDFNRIYSNINYGYCMTIYKSQGSQWGTVLINMQNIWWSICGASSNDHETRLTLFKLTYTALSRASDNILLYWR